MKLEAIKIQSNWIEFMSNIDTHISSPRKEKLIKFYEPNLIPFIFHYNLRKVLDYIQFDLNPLL